MALIFNGNYPKNIIYNGYDLAKVVYNSVVVWVKKIIQTITGNTPLILPNATADPLNEATVYGITELRKLPLEYTQVDYIEGNGTTSYLNTGIVLNTIDLDVELDFQLTESPSSSPRMAWGYMGGSSNLPRWGFGTYSTKWLGSPNQINSLGTANMNRHTAIMRTFMDGDTAMYSGTIDGNILYAPTPLQSLSTFTNNAVPVYLFARNNNGTAGNFATVKIYRLKVTKAGVLINDLIPCKRDADNAAGVYDMVNDTFITGTDISAGTPVAPTPSPDSPVSIYCNNGALKIVDDELPAAYKRVLGFSCDNNAMWEITGFKLKGSDTVRVSFSVNAACNVWGCYQGASATNNYDLYASTTSGAKYFRYGSGTYLSYWSPDDLGERFDVVYTPNGSQGMPQDSTWSPLTFTSANDLLIGSTTLTGTSAKLKGNIYGNFVVDGRLHLIPCERVSDGVLGYYDTYGATFYEPYEGFDGAVSLGYDGSHYSITADGTPEVLTVGGQNLVDLAAVTDDYYYAPSGVYTATSNVRLTDYIPVRAGQKYTIYVKAVQSGTTANVRCNLFDSAQEWKSQSVFTVISGAETVSTITPSGNGYLRVSANYAGVGARVDWSTLQVVRGEYTLATMPPYEPYVAPQTASVPMLLSVGDAKDEADLISGLLAHKIGIMVFDGSEDWRPSSSGGNIYILTSAIGVNLSAICTHFQKVSNTVSSANMPDGSFRGHPSNSVLYFKDVSAANVTDFKSWLAAQYAAGTPVIMLYALATETTETVTAQPMNAVEGTNIFESSLGSREAQVEYYKRT